MNCTATISVSESIGTTVHTREASAILMKLIEKERCNYIEVDFSKVDYIRWSFADQFYIDKLNCTLQFKKHLIVSNANEEVVHMLHTVSKTQHKKVNTFLNIPVYKYSSQSQLDDFLLSM